ncbi:MAG: sugar ABC transporter permease [Clostridia bacterium]|nr:sugar ABC transporter permease [Clostridia bacterium]
MENEKSIPAGKGKNAKRKIRNSPVFMFLCFCGLTIIGYLIFYVYPVGRTVFLSFTNKRIGIDEYDIVGFKNYITIFRYEVNFGRAILQSFIYAIGSGAITLVLSLIAALFLNSNVRGVGVFRVILFLPFVIPAFAAAAIFKGLFDPNSGIINTVLYNAFGIRGPGWFKSENTALFTMILMSVWGFGVQMLIFLAALQNVPAELYEAVELDGGGKTSKFIHVTLPSISPMLFLNIILVTINGMKSFNAGFLIGGNTGDPNYSTLLYPVLIYSEAFTNKMRVGYASALALIYFVILLVLTAGQFALSKFYVRKED